MFFYQKSIKKAKKKKINLFVILKIVSPFSHIMSNYFNIWINSILCTKGIK